MVGFYALSSVLTLHTSLHTRSCDLPKPSCRTRLFLSERGNWLCAPVSKRRYPKKEQSLPPEQLYTERSPERCDTGQLRSPPTGRVPYVPFHSTSLQRGPDNFGCTG